MRDLRFAICNLRLKPLTQGVRRRLPLVRTRSQIANRKSQIQMLIVVALTISGCVGGRQLPPAERPTPADPKLATTAYWLDQPATQHVTAENFDQLWEAARRAARSASFTIDRRDPRDGVMTTRPEVSRQVFEPWRGDIGLFDLDDTAESTLATVRRTVRFDFRKLEDGSYEVTPKVVVERYSFAERRITSPVRFNEAFGRPRALSFGDQDSDRNLPDTYWFAVRRDADLERQLADRIRGELRQMARG
jgi:hypothetical protein